VSSASSDAQNLQRFLARTGYGEIVLVRRAAPPLDFILVVPASKISKKAGKNVTSRRQLKLLVGRIRREFKLRTDWIVTQDPEQASIESGLVALVAKRFGGVFKSCLISGDADHVSVWLESTPEAPDLDRNRVEATVIEYLKLFEISSVAVIFDDDNRLPGPPALLRKLKSLAPVGVEELASAITETTKVEIDSRWLERKLDTLRRQGLAVRTPAGQFAVAERGLRLIPHGRNRSSSDIERVLLLARRQW
jgi:hypothetical protein